jgi:predicted unusual protein kinase regulating ubiquinone biosynthesis (AarF/ABC1/UbiB family)
LSERRSRSSRVPAGRLERLARLGLMAGEFAAGGLLGGGLFSAASAERLARRLSKLRGAAMKLGQLLSLESADLLPKELAEALAVLRSEADTMPATQLRRVLGREYGRGWEGRFADFDFEPIAAASIGQVHRAHTADGRDLALKIQYPGIARSIESDVDNVATLLRLGRLLPVEIDVSGLVAEAKRQLHQEADYRAEAANLRRYRELVGDDPHLLVPKVHDDLTTKRVLAMDFATGRPIEDLAAPDTPQALRDRVGERLQRLLFRELFEFHFVQTDPNFANYLFDAERERIALLDLGSARAYAPEFVASYARLCQAVLVGDRPGVREAAVAIGYLAPDEPEPRAEAAVDLMFLVCEPLRHDGVYDFAASTLAQRARDAGFDLAFRKGFLRAPPPETVFLHRKLAGTFLLCARIRARVDVRPILQPLLETEGGRPIPGSP